MIPDYVLQIQETERNLQTQSIVTRENWQDSVAKRFYEQFVDKYEETMALYINGGMGMTGKGLDELLIFFDQKQKEMAQLTGRNISIDGGFGRRVHNDYREREDWYEPFDGTQPGNLNAYEVKEVMNERNRRR